MHRRDRNRSESYSMSLKDISTLGRVRSFVRENHLIEAGDRLLLSLSAGKDSIALLDILSSLAEEFALTMGIFHLNHLSRGTESNADEEFVKKLAESHKLQLYCKRFNCLKRPAGYSFEEFSRETRYRYLTDIALDGAWDKIVTAHTGSDNVETIFMRILRGTGIHGLRGIEPKRGNLIRPMLPLTSGDVYNYLSARALKWREDESNSDNRYLRNFLRNELLPTAGRRFPSVNEALSRLSKLAVENETMMDHLIAKTYGEVYVESNGEILIHPEIFGGDERIIRHALVNAIRGHFHQYISSRMIDEIMKAYRSDKKLISIKVGRFLSISIIREDGSCTISIREKTSRETVRLPWEYRIKVPINFEHAAEIFIEEPGYSISVRLVGYETFLGEYLRKDVLFIDLPDGVDYIILRSRINGDRIRFAEGTKKIKKLLIDLKIPRPMRELVPIVMVGGDPAAVMIGVTGYMHHRVARDYMVTERSKKILAIYRAGG